MNQVQDDGELTQGMRAAIILMQNAHDSWLSADGPKTYSVLSVYVNLPFFFLLFKNTP